MQLMQPERTGRHLELERAPAAAAAATARLAQAEQEREAQGEDGTEDHACRGQSSARKPHALHLWGCVRVRVCADRARSGSYGKGEGSQPHTCVAAMGFNTRPGDCDAPR